MKKLSLSEKLSVSACFPIGFFLELALFELIAFPFACLRVKTSSLSAVFALLMIGLSVISLFINKKPYIRLRKPTAAEWVYILIFAGLFIWQVYNAVALDFTWMSADDNSYVVWANDAVFTDKMFLINEATGVAGRFNVHRAMQASLMFLASLSVLSGIPVVTVEHCILQVFYLLLAYTVYYYMAEVLFEAYEKRWIFLIFVSLLYVYGYYAPFNTSFRLLMPNYQGKAVLAVSLTPLMFSIMAEVLKAEFDWKIGVLLAMLSVASVSLTLIGAVAIVVFVGFPVIMSSIQRGRSWKNLLYIPMVSFIPALYLTVFLYSRFAM